MKCGMPGSSNSVEIDSKTWWEKTIHDTSSARGPMVAISQSRTATGAKSSYITLPIRASPQLSTVSPGSAGWLASSQSRIFSTIGDRPRSGTANSYHARRAARLRSIGVPLAAAPVRWRPGSRKANVAVASGMACSPADADRAVLQLSLLLPRGVEEPVVAEGVRHDVRRDDPVDPVHEEERRAEHLAGRLEEPDRRHRDIGVVADVLDGVVLVLEVVAREDRDVRGGRRHPRDVLALTGPAVLGPGRVEDQGLRRHAVGVDAAVQRDLGVGALGEQPGQPALE